ncbi:NAD(P)-dependent dehydrogenase (short-subunit alcohol dehydrogenase family) [Variovorax boronicumulans]|uniref:SDR family NAD(P)-dependent oxidoreductase n=1 Tax=Variovorax boronicumulans TaxID=436515 RepID=UPI00278755DD|nr:SDR family NAD(P)-dependent oxidoreductase [Variovorax boronicumulans]MDP9920452.1 NAD(P)-dependent dehydrogenase (short-subunit alcohol dehydrogenase family) [Variovorax boronicumulans]
MNSTFNAISTADDVLDGVDLRGKRIFLTGASSGLGVETARSLVAHGAHVVGTVRDLRKAQAVRAAVLSDAANVGSFDLVELDLSSLESVRRCADRIAREESLFDVLIANAGVMATPAGRTRDGFETQFGTNHLGHFLLLNRIASQIADGGRVVVVASASHRSALFSLDDLNFERTAYEPQLAYARSKTANILFAVEFDRRHPARGVRATAVHPGTIRTGLGRYMGQEVMDTAIEQLSAALVADGQTPFQWKSVAQGAATTLWAGLVAAPAEVGGRYCENCHVSDVNDGPLSPVAEGVRSYALDPETARLLWHRSEDMVGEAF